ncbi:hypothetical protein GMLC_36320 [Geomonas limicola]|uniref:PABS domain-containing protein n=1 Tax=Geomonas limicola TaxID=2740186 RepID=A0A6V8NEQ3_9BACT|nr:spermidine synthase [Geomonas limicola]GFO70053.1 hypothetical protein GMLC_36320 [Geomonas limicola]
MSSTNRNLYFSLFVLSGFSGLIYESIWTHYLKLFLGHAAYAQTLVLAIFMGGMTIGSWLCSKYSVRWKNLLAAYAVAECLIGVCALIFHVAFTRTIEFSYTNILPTLGNPLTISMYKWGISALMILPQSILLGMTFPLMSSGLLRLYPTSPGKSLGMLYFSNSIGAAFGVLASGFLLIRLTGLPGTVGIAGVFNLAIGLSVWSLNRNASLPQPEVLDQEIDSHPSAPPLRYRVFLAVSLLTGTASFIYEIGWIRMLSLVLGTSTHAFELMLSAFIVGLALGGLWIQRRIDRIANPVRYLALVQLVMGMLALSTLWFYGGTFKIVQWVVQTLPKTDTGYMLYNLSNIGIAMAIMLPTTFCAGMTLPLITYACLTEKAGEKSIGAVYAANTLGAIVGVFAAVHLGMPLLGLKGLMVSGASIDLFLGVALVLFVTRETRSFKPLYAAAALGATGILATLLFVKMDLYKMGSGVYRLGNLDTPDRYRVLFHKDGKTATVSSFMSADGMLSIRTNGKPDAAVRMIPGQAPVSDEYTMVLLGALPMTFHPNAKTAAAIGLGSGMTSHTLLCNPALEHVDTIEIERAMIEGASYFRPRVELVFSDPRSQIHNDDAKTFFSKFNKSYDLVVSEPSNPWVSGVAGLFSEEFYRLVSQHLNEQGVFVQWVQLYEINTDLVASILKAASAVFSDYAVYAANDIDMMIIARKSGSLPEPDYSVLQTPRLAADLQRLNVRSMQDLEIRKVGTKKFLDKFLRSYPIRANSDYYPVLDQSAARTRFLGASAEAITSFSNFPVPALEMLHGQRAARSRTEIAPVPNFEKSRQAFIATALRDYLVSGNLVASLPEDLRGKVQALKAGCTGNAILAEDERLGITFNLGIAMSPYLTPAELEPLWLATMSGKCASQTTPMANQWLGVLQAVGNRNAGEMLAGARALLAGSGGLTPAARHFLLVTAMLGAEARGEHVEANRLWLQYGQQVGANLEDDLLLRLLVAESSARQP